MNLKDRLFDLDEFSMFCFATSHFFHTIKQSDYFVFNLKKSIISSNFTSICISCWKLKGKIIYFLAFVQVNLYFFLLNLVTLHHVQLCKTFLNMFKCVLIFVICSNTHTNQVMLAYSNTLLMQIMLVHQTCRDITRSTRVVRNNPGTSNV